MPDSLFLVYVSLQRLVLTHHGDLFGDGLKQLPILTPIRLLRLLLAEEHQTLQAIAGSDQWNDEHDAVPNQRLNIWLRVELLFSERKAPDLSFNSHLPYERRVATQVQNVVSGSGFEWSFHTSVLLEPQVDR